MTRRTHLVTALLALAASGAMLSAQTPQIAGGPPVGFGGSVSPAFEGWFDNADGTHSFLIGYFNRSTKSEADAPIGPANHFEPGAADLGQPTHFLTGRHYGMFVFTMPKDFTKNQKVTWYLTVNGVTTSVPFYMSPDYNISPLRASEEGPTGAYNLPPVLRFEEHGASFMGPLANPSKAALERTAIAGTPMPLDIFADDDALYASGTNAPMLGNRPPVSLVVSKYRGTGSVKVENTRLETIKGGKPDEPYSGKAKVTATFGQAGDYMLHVTANDYSGNGGGGAACCWTTAIVKVSVKGGLAMGTTGQ
jgi:hypothetical protein